MTPKRKHKDASVSLHPFTIDESLKKARDARPRGGRRGRSG